MDKKYPGKPNEEFEPELMTTTWHGRQNNVTGETPVHYTLGRPDMSPIFTNIDDVNKKKRNIKLDPYRDSPLPDIFKEARNVTPTMDEIMPTLQQKKEGWGEKKSKQSKQKKGGVTKKLKHKKSKRKSTRKNRKLKRVDKKQKKRKSTKKL